VADAYARASDIRQRLVSAYPQEIEYQRKLANTIMNLGVMERQQGNLEPAREHFQQAQSRRREILDRDASATKVRRDLAMGCFNLANLHSGDLETAQTDFDDAIELFAQVRKENPKDLMIPYYLAICYRMRGALKEDNNLRTAAAEDYQLALTRMEQLARENPAVPEFRAGEARVNMNSGLLHIKNHDQPAALAALGRALRLLEDVVTQCPQTPDYERDLAVTLYWVAAIEIEDSHLPAARAHLEQAQQRFDWLHQKFPDEPEYQQWLEQVKSLLETIKTPAA
jgi:tetratricopeptide (TPR) repeat protein